MIEQAYFSTAQAEYPNLTFQKSSAESLTFLENESVDLVVAGQAAHWFDTTVLFPEMERILRQRGSKYFHSSHFLSGTESWVLRHILEVATWTYLKAPYTASNKKD